MTTQKNTYMQQLAAAVFTADEDPKVREYFQACPLAFVKPIQGQFTSLHKKYNEINLQLGQTGAGLSFEELNENEKTRILLDCLLQTFPWWVDLHGWWRTNPTYDFKAEALDVFGKGKGKEKEMVLDDADCEDDEGEDAGPLNEDLEPGEILDSEASKDDDPRLYMFHGDEDLGWDSLSDTSGSPSLSFPCPPLPPTPSSGSLSHFQPSDLPIIHHYQRPPITCLNTNVPNEIFLNSPEAVDRPKYLL
ncbi:uncharacterized protein F5891DRAFT_1181889 [Suillus fuscotomentosus]|uniref:Uncharacterized protein n=1 Tax=Suillus fuscotomentosus TaxID=1912939 RepID=A0AAD4HT40_9AGAM|nr:uncharacterized protein F5891DRAFT_1181889 [Suillus fuscotomentosus]KAG1906479.1 hypothetical protein F5891DRAFT_1181889 [Suillus fuscotomentosus]